MGSSSRKGTKKAAKKQTKLQKGGSGKVSTTPTSPPGSLIGDESSPPVPPVDAETTPPAPVVGAETTVSADVQAPPIRRPEEEDSVHQSAGSSQRKAQPKETGTARTAGKKKPVRASRNSSARRKAKADDSSDSESSEGRKDTSDDESDEDDGRSRDVTKTRERSAGRSRTEHAGTTTKGQAGNPPKNRVDARPSKKAGPRQSEVEVVDVEDDIEIAPVTNKPAGENGDKQINERGPVGQKRKRQNSEEFVEDVDPVRHKRHAVLRSLPAEPRPPIDSAPPGEVASTNRCVEKKLELALEILHELCKTVRSGDKKLDKLTVDMGDLRKELGASAVRTWREHDVKPEEEEKKPLKIGKGKRDRANVKMFNERMEKETKLVDILTQVVCLEHAVLHSVVVEFVHESKDSLVLGADALVRVLQIIMTPPKRAKPDSDKLVADRAQAFFERLVRRTIRNGEENTFDLFKTAAIPKPQAKKASLQTEKESGGNGHPRSHKGEDQAHSKQGNEKAGSEDVEKPSSANADAKNQPDDESGTGEGEKKSVDGTTGDPRADPPLWLIPEGQIRYISKEHVEEARRIEAIGGKKSSLARRSEIGLGVKEPGKDDIAVYVCRTAFQKLTVFLNDSRKSIERAFYEDFGHLFTTWTYVEEDGIDQAKLSLTWSAPFKPAMVIPIREISGAKIKECGVASVDTYNHDVFCKLKLRTKELVLLVRHDVLVNKPRSGSEKKSFPHHVHMLDVAVRLLAGYMQVKKSKGREAIEMLATHKSSLAVVYEIAVVLRMVFTNQNVHMPDACPVTVVAHSEDDVVPISSDVATTILEILTPARSHQQSTLPTILCGLTAAAYKKKCIPSDGSPKKAEKKKLIPSAPLPDDEVTLDLS